MNRLSSMKEEENNRQSNQADEPVVTQSAKQDGDVWNYSVLSTKEGNRLAKKDLAIKIFQ